MAQTVGDIILQRLNDWGVNHVFGYPGDGINGLLAAWERAAEAPRFLQARHEEMAAFEAVGYAKFSDKVGVCCATSGPGAIHLLNGLYDAKLDHVPVVAIVGQTGRTAMGGSYPVSEIRASYRTVAAHTAPVKGYLVRTRSAATARRHGCRGCSPTLRSGGAPRASSSD